jgi:hypothetical protein
LRHVDQTFSNLDPGLFSQLRNRPGRQAPVSPSRTRA